MANNNRILVPESRQALNSFKAKVMKNEGYHAQDPSQVKYEVAQQLGIPLQKGYNGSIEAKNAGKIGGKIGGSMVREMIRLAKENIKK